MPGQWLLPVLSRTALHTARGCSVGVCWISEQREAPSGALGSCPGPCLVAVEGGKPFSSLISLSSFVQWGPRLDLCKVSSKCLNTVNDGGIMLTLVYFSQAVMDVKDCVKNRPPCSFVTLPQMPTFKADTNVVSLKPPEHPPGNLFCRAWTSSATGLQPQHPVW